MKKGYISNPATWSCDNGKYLSCTIDCSVITCDEIIEGTTTVATNFNKKKASYKM